MSDLRCGRHVVPAATDNLMGRLISERWRIVFPNGYEASIFRGDASFGAYELAVVRRPVRVARPRREGARLGAPRREREMGGAMIVPQPEPAAPFAAGLVYHRQCELASCGKRFTTTNKTKRFHAVACRNRSLNDRYLERKRAAGAA